MSAFSEKMAWTVLAVAIAALAQLPALAGAQQFMMMAAGTVFGAAWLKSVDERHAQRRRESLYPAAGKAKRPPRMPPPPAAAFVLLALLPALAAPLQSCAGAAAVVRTVVTAVDAIMDVVDQVEQHYALVKDSLTPAQRMAIEDAIARARKAEPKARAATDHGAQAYQDLKALYEALVGKAGPAGVHYTDQDAPLGAPRGGLAVPRAEDIER